jgi:dolichol-phosphate mannosyltransferase
MSVESNLVVMEKRREAYWLKYQSTAPIKLHRYPFLKILCNRAFHVLVKLLLLPKVRDVSNNLKLYRSEILKNLKIEEPHFAANLETGLKPLLAGYDVEEVPVSWINRTVEMGSSSFRIVSVAPNYLMSLVRIIWRSWRAGNPTTIKPHAKVPEATQRS